MVKMSYHLRIFQANLKSKKLLFLCIKFLLC